MSTAGRVAPASSGSNMASAAVEVSNARIQLNIPSEVVKQLPKSAGDSPSVLLAFGNVVTLQVGSHIYKASLANMPNGRELYSSTGAQPKGTLRLEGRVTKTLNVSRQDATKKAPDPALLALKEAMDDLERKKKANSTVFISDISQLPLPASSRSRSSSGSAGRAKGSRFRTTASKAAKPSIATSSSVKQPINPSYRHKNDTPLAPVVNRHVGPPDRSEIRLQALRPPFLHVLAIRPATEAQLMKRLHCSRDDCLELLKKHAERVPSSDEWQLEKRSYRKLDVWDFPFASSEERQKAIENAITAFDRMRVSRDDQLWQSLLPKSSRGKGIILSRLQLHLPLVGKSFPRSIKATSGTDEGITANKDSESSLETDASDASRKQQTAKAVARPGNATVVARPPLPNGVEKAAAKPGTKTVSKPAAKPVIKRVENGAVQKNRGRDQKSVRKNGTTKNGSNVKSSEYIHDSDDDVEMDDVPPVSKPDKPGVTRGAMSKSPSATSRATGSKLPTSVASSVPKASVRSPEKPIRSNLAGQSVKTEPAKTQPGKAQPVKTHSGKTQSGKTQPGKAQPVKTQSSKTQPVKPQLVKTQPAKTLPAKTAPAKRDPNGYKAPNAPRKPSPLGSSPPTNATDLESEDGRGSSSSSTPLMSQIRRGQAGAHAAVVAPSDTTSQSSSDQPLARSLKRKATSTASANPPAKRQQKSPPLAGGYSSSSGTSPELDSMAKEYLMNAAKRFKADYSEYARLHQEITRLVVPKPEQIKQVRKLHDQLKALKADIARQVADDAKRTAKRTATK